MNTEIEPSRRQFRKLLITNPNYFGTLTDPGLAELFPAEEEKVSDTGYEEIGCVSFSPERDRLEATVVIKRPAGYGGDPCGTGSLEWLRFFVDLGAGWTDAGAAAVRVYDLPVGDDCSGEPDHPYTIAVGVPLSVVRRFCFATQLPRVRAILSWEAEPTAGDPDYVPVWGEVQEDVVQIRPRPLPAHLDVSDLLAHVGKIDRRAIDELLDAAGLRAHDVVPGPVDPTGIVLPSPGLEEPGRVRHSPRALARLYSERNLMRLGEQAVDDRVAEMAREFVPPDRYAFGEVDALLHGPLSQTAAVESILRYQALDIDWKSLTALLDDGSGDTSYEELECLALDDRAGQLVATFRVKRPTGYSGPPCSAGSTEHVAFWADFDDDCGFTYLGTVDVAAHDFITMPGDGLSYAAVLAVDLTAHRRPCTEPGLHRVRAVLSWGALPSTTDPDAVPHWGNRLDTHVHVLPGRKYDGTATLTIVGGVATDEIDPTTGVTRAVAHIAYNGTPLDPRGCPFAGTVTAHGPTDPALAGRPYRLLVCDVTAGSAPHPVMTTFRVVDNQGHSSLVTPGTDGWLPWPDWTTNTLGTLGYIATSGDHLWQVLLELAGDGIVRTQVIQLDHTLNTTSLDPDNAAHLAFDENMAAATGCGSFTKGMDITGTFDARDTYFRSWQFSLLPKSLPTTALTTTVGSSASEAPVGSRWTLKTADLEPCGYVLRLTVRDRTVVSSAPSDRHAVIDIGFCLQ